MYYYIILAFSVTNNSRGWVAKFATGLIYQIRHCSKLHKWSSCPLAKMSPWLENYFGNIIACRAWVSTGAAGAWHPPKFWTSPLAPADFEVLNTNWHPQSLFYATSGTLSFKFLTQAPGMVTHILFELCPIWYISPVANFVTHPLEVIEEIMKIVIGVRDVEEKKNGKM